jgi:hypothetical protein
MRYEQIAPASARRLCGLTAVLAGAVLLAGCRFGSPVSFLDEGSGIAQAIDRLRQHLSSPAHVLNVAIEPARIALRVQHPKHRNRVEEWRVARVAMAGMNWDRVSGPHAYELMLTNPDLEGNLFDLDEIDFVSTPRLARAALERAALPGKAEVVRIEIARQVFVVPNPASGEVRWTFDVRTEGESVQVFADTQGTIVGMNVDGTKRARNLDLTRELDLVAEAARSFRFVMGRDAILTAVYIAPRAVTFEMTVPESSGSAARDAAAAQRLYNWTLNGLQRVPAQPDAVAPEARARFSIDDADFTMLPKLTTAALAQLSMPQGRITRIELARLITPGGPAVVTWKIEVADQDRKGIVLADATGEVKQVMR